MQENNLLKIDPFSVNYTLSWRKICPKLCTRSRSEISLPHTRVQWTLSFSEILFKIALFTE